MGSRPGPVPPPGAARPAPGPVNHCSRRRSVERSERKSRPGAEPQAQAGLGWAWPSFGRAGLASRSPPRPKGLLSWGALSRLPSSLPKPAHKSHKAAQPQLPTRHPTLWSRTQTMHRDLWAPINVSRNYSLCSLYPRRKSCAHRDPSRPPHVDTGSSHCGSKLSTGGP